MIYKTGVAALLLLTTSGLGSGRGSGQNVEGCDNNRKTAGYHCHHTLALLPLPNDATTQASTDN